MVHARRLGGFKPPSKAKSMGEYSPDELRRLADKKQGLIEEQRLKTLKDVERRDEVERIKAEKWEWYLSHSDLIERFINAMSECGGSFQRGGRLGNERSVMKDQIKKVFKKHGLYNDKTGAWRKS